MPSNISARTSSRFRDFAETIRQQNPIPKADRDALLDIVLNQIGLFRNLRIGIDDWKELVFSGQIEFCESDAKDLREELQTWISITRSVLDVIEPLEAIHSRNYNFISNTDLLKADFRHAETMASNWKTPQKSAIRAFWTEELSEDESEAVFDALGTGKWRPTFLPSKCEVKEN